MTTPRAAPRPATRILIRAIVPLWVALLLQPDGAFAQQGDATPTVTELPRGCALLSSQDVEEILGAEVVDWGETDLAHFNCSFTAASGSRLTFAGFVGSGTALEDAQPGIHAEQCESEVVREVEELGADAALLRDAREDEYVCGGYRLWVVTDARFRGKLNPELLRTSEGPFHLVFQVDGVPDEERLRILREAARRVIEGLDDRLDVGRLRRESHRGE